MSKQLILDRLNSMTPEQRNQLTPEQISTIREALDEPEEVSEVVEPSNMEIQYDSEEEKAIAEGIPTAAEAFSTGVISGIPFAKDVVAGVDAISSAISEEDMSFDNAYEKYKSNMKDGEQAVRASSEASPWITGAGAITGTVGSVMAGGAALKAAGAGSALTGTGLNVASGLITSTAQGVSNENVGERGIEDAASGLASGLIGEGIGYGIGKLAKVAKSSIAKGLISKADDIKMKSLKSSVGLEKTRENVKLFQHLKKTNQTEVGMLARLDESVLSDGTKVVSPKYTPAEQLNILNLKKDEVGAALADAYKVVDKDFDIKINVKDLKDSLIDDVAGPMLRSDDPEKRLIGEDIQNYISKIGQKVSGARKETTPDGVKIIEDIVYDDSWNLQRVHKLQKDINNRIQSIYSKNKASLTESKEQQRLVAQRLGGAMDEILESVSTSDNPILKTVKEMRLDYGNAALITDTLENKLAKTSASTAMDSVKDLLSPLNIVAGVAGGPQAVLFAMAAKKIKNDPNIPVYTANGLEAVANLLRSEPTSKLATRIMSAGIQSTEDFKKTLNGTIAELGLRTAPIERTSSDAIKKSDHIKNYLEYASPEMASAYEDVIDNGDEEQLAALLDQVSKLPGANKFFKPGIGFNGRVYSEEDKAQLVLQIKQSNVPAAKRIQLIKQINEQGVIPDLQKQAQPEPPKVYQPRDKRKLQM